MKTTTAFAPVLAIANDTNDINFYKKAFNATENFCLRNDDGSIHVAELVIDGAVFHVHEITEFSGTIPVTAGKGTVNIGLFVDDVYAIFNQAIAAGAEEAMSVTDFEYGYRQAELIDPFGHKWIIECRIPTSPHWKW